MGLLYILIVIGIQPVVISLLMTRVYLVLKIVFLVIRMDAMIVSQVITNLLVYVNHVFTNA